MTTEIHADRLLVFDPNAMGVLHPTSGPATLPALHTGEVNDYAIAFDGLLRAGEIIESGAWSTSPVGLTTSETAGAIRVAGREKAYTYGRIIRLSTPVAGVRYTLTCSVTTDQGRSLIGDFYVMGR